MDGNPPLLYSAAMQVHGMPVRDRKVHGRLARGKSVHGKQDRGTRHCKMPYSQLFWSSA
jgi:hypothetical protein